MNLLYQYPSEHLDALIAKRSVVVLSDPRSEFTPHEYAYCAYPFTFGQVDAAS